MAEKRFCYKKNEINLMNIKKKYVLLHFSVHFALTAWPISNAPMIKKKKRCQQPNFLIDQALEQISYFEYQLSCFQFRISKIGQHDTSLQKKIDYIKTKLTNWTLWMNRSLKCKWFLLLKKSLKFKNTCITFLGK